MPLMRVCASAFASLALLPCCSAQLSFNAPQSLATGFQHLNAYATGDFNGDGKLDLAFDDGYDKRIVVYLNNGTGGFGAPVITNLNVNFTVGGIAAGDINEDGKQDLIVSAGGTVPASYILLGKGDGTFTANGTLPNSFEFLQGRFVDLNADKHLDFISSGNGNVAVYLGDGKGGFTAKPLSSQDSYPKLSVVVADFNRDNKPDLMIADYGNSNAGISGSLFFYPGNGDGTFGAPAQIQPFPKSGGYDFLAAADFNGDNRLDLAFSLPSIAVIALGNGDGTFNTGLTQMIYPPQSSASSTFTDAYPLAVADFDGNGTSDIAVASGGDNVLYVSLNDGTGSFPQAKADFQAGIDANTSFVMTADLNGDGLPDIITGSYTTNKVLVFLSQRVKTTPAVALSASATQVIPGSAITFTTKVTGASGTPTGTVTFADGTATLGQVALDGNGQATFTTSSLGAGQHSITATYAGDTRFNGAASSAIATSVVDFALSLGTASQTIAVGATASYPLTFTGAGGLSGTVTLTCSGLPTGYSCTSPTVSLGSQPVTATLSVSAATQALLQAPEKPFRIGSGLALAALPLGFWLLVPGRRRWTGAGLCSAVVLACGCFWISGCSGGSSSTSAPTTPTPYRGTSNFTITAAVQVGAQTVSHQTTATLTVQ